MKRSRRAILESHDLLIAPRDCQRAFWQQYNRRWRHWVPKLGDVAFDIVSDQSIRAARRLDRLSELWLEVVPVKYRDLTRVESFRAGRLWVSVDCAATRYYLGRQVGGSLVAALNQRMEEGATGRRIVRVERIDYRVASSLC